MTLPFRTLIIAAASTLIATAALAQAPATAPATTTTSAKPPRTAVSLDCSKQADAKGLHGKERHKFRSDCKKAAAKT